MIIYFVTRAYFWDNRFYRSLFYTS